MNLPQSMVDVSHPFRNKKRKGWGTGHLFGYRAGVVFAIVASYLLILSGCGHQQTDASLPAPEAAPPIASSPAPLHGISAEDRKYIRTHRPILTEEGMASWYRAPYKGAKAANGQVFNDHALTAAHRTLPMGSLVVVTNLKTGQSAAMRITDRGPFVEGRVIDLSIASAKATGVYLAGTARVRIDVYRTPKPIDTGGRWCVQIGAFASERKAKKLKVQLERKYPGASVIEFSGEDKYWVRIRPEGDDRKQAERIARQLHPAEGEVFLTRLD